MTKNELINDFNFRDKCSEYGLDWEKANIYGDLILINTPIKGLYVIFDKNYNTIGVEKNEYQDEKQFANEFYKKYSECTDKMLFGDNFTYPFQNYTIKNFIDLANKIHILEHNHGNNISIKIDDELYNRNSRENEEYFQLLSYVKFISEEIKIYFLISYHMQVMGFEVPDIYSYIHALIKNLNITVDYHIKNNQRPWPSDILASIGQNNVKLNFDKMLYDIVDLLLNQKGVKIKSGSSDDLEQIEPIYSKDLSVLSDNLLRIIDLSKNVDDSLEKSPVLKKINKTNNPKNCI